MCEKHALSDCKIVSKYTHSLFADKSTQPFEKYSLAELRRITDLLTNILPTISLGSRYIKLHELRFHNSPAKVSSDQHTHDIVETVLLLSDSITYTWQIPHIFKVGGCIVFPPECMHEWNTDNDDALRLIFWYEDDLLRSYQDAQQTPHRPETGDYIPYGDYILKCNYKQQTNFYSLQAIAKPDNIYFFLYGMPSPAFLFEIETLY